MNHDLYGLSEDRIKWWAIILETINKSIKFINDRIAKGKYVSKQKSTMETITFGSEFLFELESEVRATRRCLEVIPEKLYDWKPHEKSMNLGYLSLLVAEIPKWIKNMVETSEIDFVTYDHFKLSTNAALLNHFDENIQGAGNALKNVTNEELLKPFYLKNNGQVVFTSSKKESIGSSINHMVHHRGQLTVYMRLNNLPVPSIYGPSADDRGF